MYARIAMPPYPRNTVYLSHCILELNPVIECTIYNEVAGNNHHGLGVGVDSTGGGSAMNWGGASAWP